jgi:hypothetical protein
MYYVIHPRSLRDLSDCVVLSGPHISLVQAKAGRAVSGDLVIDKMGDVVKNSFWLWGWEKADSRSYANQSLQT